MGLCQSAPVGDSSIVELRRRHKAPQQQEQQQEEDGGGCDSSRPVPKKSQQQRDGDCNRGGKQAPGLAAGGDPSRSILGRLDAVRQRYSFDKVLGKGQFGVTRLVVDVATGEQCACKSISKRKLVSAEDAEDVRREIKVMHHLSGHPHVVAFKGAYEDEHHVHIVMELCTGGELFEQLSAKGHYRERDAAHIMRTLLQVVQHCHAMNVVHRDLKPENFLFKDGGKRGLKAIDFGLSAFYTEGAVLRDLVGSPFYMAPEVLRRSYGKAADIWSCGVIMYILLCGWPPFYGSNAQQIFRAVLHDSLDLASPPWDAVSPQAKDCVRRMLVRDPRRRPDAAAVLGHEWLRGGAAAGASEAPLQPEILQRMRRFAGMNRFKKEALRVVAAHLPPEEIEGIRQMFADLDRDKSGTISFEELREGLRHKGAHVADGELQRIMASVDLDGNHTLDFQEFLTATVFLGKLQRRENLMAAFAHFDTDGSGFISEDELLQALVAEGVSAGAIESLLAEVDRDNNRRIDYDEFARMMLEDDAARDGRRGSSMGIDPQQQQHNGGGGRTPGAGSTPRCGGGSSGRGGSGGGGGGGGDSMGGAAAAGAIVGFGDLPKPHLARLDSTAKHTLHGVKSGAWLPGQVRSGVTLEEAVDLYSAQISGSGQGLATSDHQQQAL